MIENKELLKMSEDHKFVVYYIFPNVKIHRVIVKATKMEQAIIRGCRQLTSDELGVIEDVEMYVKGFEPEVSEVAARLRENV